MERPSARLRTTLLGLLVGVSLLVAPLGAAADTVTSSAVDHIVIQPNDRPTIVDTNTDLQFLATAYAADEQPLSGLTFTWSTEGSIGRIAADGLFTGEHGGIGTVTARNGQVTATVGVVVRAVATTTTEPPATNTNTSQVPPTTTTVTNVNATTNTAGDETVTETPSTTEEPATDDATTCTTLRGWVWILILLVYAFFLFVYYLSLGESMTKLWWAWPTAATLALLALFWRLQCAGHQLWVPITLLVVGILLSLFYARLLRPRQAPPAPIQ